ncbi:MAG: hypothetical protein ACI3YJ_04040, partial [Prevotella sp.]
PGRCPGLRASALSGRAACWACCFQGVLLAGRAACMGFCPFRACCLLGVLLVWASALAERAACMSFCPFRACCLYGLLPLLGVLLLKLTSSVLYS